MPPPWHEAGLIEIRKACRDKGRGASGSVFPRGAWERDNGMGQIELMDLRWGGIKP